MNMAKLILCVFGLLLGLWACSNDAELPAQYHVGLLAQPANVVTAVEDGAITVTWEMTSEVNVTGFVISFTDLSGVRETRSLEDATARMYEETGLDLSEGAVYLIEVWAVDENQFFGPHSTVDSLAVL
jgi:hypothetical protein